VHLEASTKPHVHQKFEIFWTNIASTMACPNFKNGSKIGLRPLGVNACHIGSFFIHSTPCRIDLHPSILSSCLSHVKQHVLLCSITYPPKNWAPNQDRVHSSYLYSCKEPLNLVGQGMTLHVDLTQNFLFFP
jgi:hypothetical protein